MISNIKQVWLFGNWWRLGQSQTAKDLYNIQDGGIGHSNISQALQGTISFKKIVPAGGLIPYIKSMLQSINQQILETLKGLLPFLPLYSHF